VLGKKPIRHVAEGRDGSSRAVLGYHVDPFFDPAEQLSGFDPSFVRRHAAMRPDLHAPGPAVLPTLRDVDLAAGWKGGDPKSCDCVIPKNAAILARLAFMRIDRALGDAVVCHGTGHR
jgi:hypothetical protein